MVKTGTVPLTCVQTKSDESEPSDRKICSRCDEKAEWREAISKSTVLDRRSGLVESSQN